jgi:hypothetical protein
VKADQDRGEMGKVGGGAEGEAATLGEKEAGA